MNRNVNSHFAYNPTSVNIPRSRWARPNRLKTTFNSGALIPIYCSEILPGDSVSMNVSGMVRMTTPIFPVLDDAYIDTFFFFCPHRLVWDHFVEFMGENKDLPWTQTTEYQVPHIKTPIDSNGVPTGWNVGSLGDYFGYPINSKVDFSVSALPLRSYVKIWNDWFRDTNTMPSAYLQLGDNDIQGRQMSENATPSQAITEALYGGRPLQVSKYFDYFTGALPQPQKGDASSIPVSGILPVYTSSIPNLYNSVAQEKFGSDPNSLTFSSSYLGYEDNPGDSYPLMVTPTSETAGYLDFNEQQPDGNFGGTSEFWPNNLKALADGSNFNIFVNDVRLAFQLQKLLERDARGGTRYIELVLSHFGVRSPDARLQRSEYLGGSHISLNMAQVVQNSATSEISPQGNVAGLSSTPWRDSSFTKSFTEHGLIIGLACVRTKNSYQQNINKAWSRRRRFDFYWPVLANIGEQPILKKELFVPADENETGVFDSQLDEVFGYQEAWAEYRYMPDMVTGKFRSNALGTLDSWHYATAFGADQTLENLVVSDDFIYETDKNIQRTLAVQDEPQFIADFSFDSTWTRVMPLYSIPGQIDHF